MINNTLDKELTRLFLLRKNYKQLIQHSVTRVILTNGKYENKQLCSQLEDERELIELTSSL